MLYFGKDILDANSCICYITHTGCRIFQNQCWLSAIMIIVQMMFQYANPPVLRGMYLTSPTMINPLRWVQVIKEPPCQLFAPRSIGVDFPTSSWLFGV